MSVYMGWAGFLLEALAVTFVVILGMVALIVVILFIIDRSQTSDAVRRNYPVLGRFRHIFSELGEFFRQYFFAMDREELPFNRAQREWIGRASKGESNTVAFGSTRAINVTGTPLFSNAAFPPIDGQYAETALLVIGPDCPNPFVAKSIINISGMSYGALSRPAI